MSTVVFDTLKLAQRLRDNAKFSQEQAEQTAVALAESFGDWQEKQQLVTKADLAEAKTDIIKWVIGMGFALAALFLGLMKLHS